MVIFNKAKKIWREKDHVSEEKIKAHLFLDSTLLLRCVHLIAIWILHPSGFWLQFSKLTFPIFLLFFSDLERVKWELPCSGNSVSNSWLVNRLQTGCNLLVDTVYACCCTEPLIWTPVRKHVSGCLCLPLSQLKSPACSTWCAGCPKAQNSLST